ncbi:hypothetical protein [Microbacterium lacticum]
MRLGTSADAEATAVDLHLDDGVITGIHPAARASDGAPGSTEDDDLRRVVDLATGAATPFAGLPDGGLVVGARADIVLLDAENAMDALVRTLPRDAVIAGGRLLVG